MYRFNKPFLPFAQVLHQGANGLVPPTAFKKLFLLACLPTYLDAKKNLPFLAKVAAIRCHHLAVARPILKYKTTNVEVNGDWPRANDKSINSSKHVTCRARVFRPRFNCRAHPLRTARGRRRHVPLRPCASGSFPGQVQGSSNHHRDKGGLAEEIEAGHRPAGRQGGAPS